MNVLIVGGSGQVGSLILPMLKEKLTLRVLDLVPPADGDVEYLPGDVNDPDAAARAVPGMDALVYMVMPALSEFQEPPISYDLNVKAVHLVLEAAYQAGIRRAVYASTGSVHDHGRARYNDEDLPLDSPSVYGLTKGLGEQVCRWFCQRRGMTIVALRLFRPLGQDAWRQAVSSARPHFTAATSARDLAGAFLAALTAEVTGFHAVFVASDRDNRQVNVTRARHLLGWRPQDG